MARHLVSTEKFRRAYRRLSASNQQLVEKALEQLGGYLKTGLAPVGLGITKLAPGVFEVRAGLDVRIVYVEEGPRCFLALLGDHDEVRRFLKRQ
ncbi:MAG TPA: hypothetical protein DDX89_01435 [Candidatus Omnitrophica bacterium]|nr:MAG: hypothetical protein A2Z92_02390 [Omnitrophica WOR_2 bacterium GWA2_63_20]OGX35942.1 MAG: hypothetical protein A3B73_01005 [Omnitrophica WOR_2 bacterium RIFCSPHIGHO2_02_FULL_63_39]OGX44334.1 MAG: hypothetical protein A3I71_05140 [Omnitrophica WOR_2 bacterium RIFCSPLOWO2_02_FULL_63_16]OGX47638.1 MAG: hypothetical protein A3G88_07685 [Omnitrophica WOR_2 bacterium RIFCSPLOWO2_12_FULL_63_16]HBH96441.1 hypothetical protein [Candidatus Omnitrophota bacterium]